LKKSTNPKSTFWGKQEEKLPENKMLGKKIITLQSKKHFKYLQLH